MKQLDFIVMEAKIIIIDLNQVMISNLLMQLGNHTNAEIDENMVRHMILNSIRSFNVKFSREYGEMVIACDNINVWRKQVFPYYKANRKKKTENSELNWKSIFECMNKIRSELKEYFPYKVIDVEFAEADDIIGTLVKEFGQKSKILILSGDKDFIQLHTSDNVKQYDPVRKKWITHSDPFQFLNEHIMKGDAGDGVPNILSSDNCFVVGERQKPLSAKKMKEFLQNNFKNISPQFSRNYHRNKQLIDLSFTPVEIKEKVIDQYKGQTNKDRSKLINYFIANKLKNLMENISEF